MVKKDKLKVDYYKIVHKELHYYWFAILSRKYFKYHIDFIIYAKKFLKDKNLSELENKLEEIYKYIEAKCKEILDEYKNRLTEKEYSKLNKGLHNLYITQLRNAKKIAKSESKKKKSNLETKEDEYFSLDNYDSEEAYERHLEMTKKRDKKIISIVAIVLASILILTFCLSFFIKEANWIIYANNREITATNIIYYGPDINSESASYIGKENTNGIICIFSRNSLLEIFLKGNVRKYEIIGNVKSVYNVHAKKNMDSYMTEIDKYYYLNWTDYPYWGAY